MVHFKPRNRTIGVFAAFLISKPEAAASSSHKAASVTERSRPQASFVPTSEVIAGTL